MSTRLAIRLRHGERRDDVRADSAGACFLDVDGVELASLRRILGAPFISACATLGQRLGTWAYVWFKDSNQLCASLD